jgi:predicted metal-dependent hydrolase
MASKQFKLDAETLITVYKRRSSKNLKLSISSTGSIRVSVPIWAPYASGLNFAISRLEWIRAQAKSKTYIVDGQSIGKSHHIRFSPTVDISKPSSRIVSTEIIVKYPLVQAINDDDVQLSAARASLKALRYQAEALLPRRLVELSIKHGFSYGQVSIKKLKSRWGSCDSQQNIVLNFFLMQLPWELIDYVLLHELAHTKVLRHGPDFWELLESLSPKAKTLRKQINTYQPILHSPNDRDVA